MEFLAPNNHTDTYYPHYIKQGVCHTVAFAIYIKKYLKAKEE
jgi:hypothetical protein